MQQVSIIVRTFNEEKHIGNLLSAIGRQEYKNHEVIIVDSGSTDRTLEIAQEFQVTVIKIKSQDFTFGYSLNIGCQKSKGKYLVFASAHVLPVDEHWLSNLVAPFADEKVAMVYGRQKGDEGAKFSEKMDLKRLFGESPLNSKVVLNYANNANAAVRKSLWEEHPFDEYLFGLEDIDWARYMAAKGYFVHYAPKATVYHIHREAWHQVFNRYRREAIAAFRIGLPHPPQARLGVFWLAINLLKDTASSFPSLSFARLEEIARFRYYQWKGSRQGWFKDRHLDFDREKFDLFFPQDNRAVVIRDKHQAEIERKPLPEMKPGDILLQVSHVGICHTDLEVHQGTLGYYQEGTAQYPITPGHEYSGTIVKIGANNKYRERFKVGQRVVGECILSREQTDRKEVGVINHDGAYAQFVVVPGNAIHHIPDALSMETAVLAEPLAVVLRALRRVRGRVPNGARAAVVGAGPIGNLCAQVLKLEGHTVSVFDKNEDRLHFLAQTAEVSTDIGRLEQFDFIVEATGSKEVLERVLKESRTDATILLLGFPYGEVAYNFENLVGREKVIVGSVGADTEDFAKALKLLPQLQTEAFTEHVLPLGEFKKAWELHSSGKHLKILLKP